MFGSCLCSGDETDCAIRCSELKPLALEYIFLRITTFPSLSRTASSTGHPYSRGKATSLKAYPSLSKIFPIFEDSQTGFRIGNPRWDPIWLEPRPELVTAREQSALMITEAYLLRAYIGQRGQTSVWLCGKTKDKIRIENKG